MSDTNTTASAPAIPIKALTKTDENGNVIATVTPELKVIERGDYAGNVYPTIVVTQQNLNDYVKLRGLDRVLDVLNSRERIDAQAALEYVLPDEDQDWEELEVLDKKGMKVSRWSYVPSRFLSVIEKFWDTLLSGKVRGGVTIADLEGEQETILAEMNAKVQKMPTAAPSEAQALMMEAAALSTKYSELSAQINEIRQSRKPRKTKAEKAAEAAKKASSAAPAPVPA